MLEPLAEASEAGYCGGGESCLGGVSGGACRPSWAAASVSAGQPGELSSTSTSSVKRTISSDSATASSESSAIPASSSTLRRLLLWGTDPEDDRQGCRESDNVTVWGTAIVVEYGCDVVGLFLGRTKLQDRATLQWQVAFQPFQVYYPQIKLMAE